MIGAANVVPSNVEFSMLAQNCTVVLFTASAAVLTNPKRSLFTVAVVERLVDAAVAYAALSIPEVYFCGKHLGPNKQ